MKPENAADLLSEDDIDGRLIDGASLTVEDFAAFLAAAASRALRSSASSCSTAGAAPRGRGRVDLADTPTSTASGRSPHTQLDRRPGGRPAVGQTAKLRGGTPTWAPSSSSARR